MRSSTIGGVSAALARTITRRRLMATALAAAGALALGNASCDPAIMRRVRQVESRQFPRHAVWVWQFSIDGTADAIAETMAAYQLAAIVKTHDGIEWMAKYDPVEGAIDGPAQVETIAGIFERAAVPFHAWAVVKGVDAAREAEMAAQVLDAGARSLTLDVEGGEGFWHGTPDDAVRFGTDLRLRHEFARIDISIDPRPWKMLEIPLAEFAAFADGIRPQLYWDHFDDDDHANAYAYFGFPPGAEGITPEFLVETTRQLLAPFDRWILPVAAGNPVEADAWDRFMQRSRELEMPEVSAWRYGTVTNAVLRALADYPPGVGPPPIA